jgi:putative oxidoreductase
MSLRQLTIWGASIIAALGIGLAGITKFVAPAHWQELFTGWGLPQWFLPVVGAIEIAGGVALLVPRLSLYGVLLLGSVMIGAIGTLLIHPTPHFGIMLPAVYILLLIAIAICRVRGAPGREPLT